MAKKENTEEGWKGRLFGSLPFALGFYFLWGKVCCEMREYVILGVRETRLDVSFVYFITLRQREWEKLQNIIKSMLEKLFV